MAGVCVSSCLFFICCLAFLQEVTEVAGLKCRVENDERTQEYFNDVVRACMHADIRDEEMTRPSYNNNNNNNNNWHGNRPQWTQGIPRFPTRDRERDRERDEQDEDEDSREQPSDYGSGDGKGRGSQRGYKPHPRSPRTRRAPPSRNIMGPKSNLTHGAGRRRQPASPLDEIEPCVVHCIFQQMRMLDKSNQPEKSAVLGVMTNKLRDTELRDFLRDAISECFDILESESQNTKCSFTKSFAMCLEQKGQQNCEDWNDETKKPNQKHSGMNINKYKGHKTVSVEGGCWG